MKLLIQSLASGAFLVPDENNQPCWVNDFAAAGCGVLDDFDNAAQMIIEYCDFDDRAQIVDLEAIFNIRKTPDSPF